MAHATSGGFLQPLLTPPPSSVASSTAGTSLLPYPRRAPLKSGSSKESAFINAVDQRVLRMTRKLATKKTGTNPGDDDGDARRPGRHANRHPEGGYNNFRDVARDIGRVTDIVWVSGTPSLQVPYLLNMALLLATHLPSFPPAPKAMFRVLRKLDYAFASLVSGQDLDTGAQLSGYLNGIGLSATEKVRIKSLVERTRVVVVEALDSDEFAEEEDADDDDDEYGDGRHGHGSNDDDDGDRFADVYGTDDHGLDIGMEIARVYDKTLVELGDSLIGPEIGIGATNE